MAYSTEDYRDILEHLMSWLQLANLSDVAEGASAFASDFRTDENDLKHYTEAFVTGVVETLKRRSRRTFTAALQTCNEHIETRDGQEISDIILVAQPEDRSLLGFEEISLGSAPDFDDLIESLQDVIHDLEENQ